MVLFSTFYAVLFLSVAFSFRFHVALLFVIAAVLFVSSLRPSARTLVQCTDVNAFDFTLIWSVLRYYSVYVPFVCWQINQNHSHDPVVSSEVNSSIACFMGIWWGISHRHRRNRNQAQDKRISAITSKHRSYRLFSHPVWLEYVCSLDFRHDYTINNFMSGTCECIAMCIASLRRILSSSGGWPML